MPKMYECFGSGNFITPGNDFIFMDTSPNFIIF